MGLGIKWVPMVLALCGVFPASAATIGARRAPVAIVIGVDGLSVDGVVRARTPRLHELMRRGAFTLEARGVMPTLSSPNWESAIGGAGPEQHGITSNGYFRRLVEFQPTCRDAEGHFPTIFGVLREQRPQSRIAVFHDWGGFASLVEKRAPDAMQHEPGAPRTVRAAIEYWKRNRPALLFIHLDNVDHAGHRVGWLDPAYYQAVTDADSYVGMVLDAVDQEGARESTFILVTSDHGGTRRGHGKNSLAEIQIPWILSGPGIAPGRIEAPVNTYDTAVTLAWIFDLETPRCWTGRPVLAAFQPAAVLAKNKPDEKTAPTRCADGTALAGGLVPMAPRDGRPAQALPH
jgi:Type I phosphodiesterase / nucleotide pyrophosphatase